MKRKMIRPADMDKEPLWKKLSRNDRHLCSCGRPMEYHQHFEQWKCAKCGWEDEQ